MHHLARLCLLLLLTTGFASATDESNTTNFRHLAKSKSTTCEDCHGVEKPTSPAKTEVCGDCHGDIQAEYKPRVLKYGNREMTINVHDSHYGDIECLTCHKIHSRGKLMCNECHKLDIEPK